MSIYALDAHLKSEITVSFDVFCIYFDLQRNILLKSFTNRFVPEMTKSERVAGKRAVMKYASSKTPFIDPSPSGKLSFKETKRRTILAGLRCMKAPAVAWPNLTTSI